MNNGAGYYGSGGSWVTPEMGMQSIVQSEVHVAGGHHLARHPGQARSR